MDRRLKFSGMIEEIEDEGYEAKEMAKRSLFERTLKRDWDKFVEIYKQRPEIRSSKITQNDDTALHVALTHAPEETVKKLLDEIDMTQDYNEKQEAVSAKNKQGNTPLHSAAARGLTAICDRMISVDPLLVGERNDEAETPLFLAALQGHKETFLHLHHVSIVHFRRSSSPPWRGKGGDTILHCTIRREHFDLAFLIIHLYEDQSIASCFNDRDMKPLHVLASKPSAFPSSTRLRWWAKILYHCIIVEPLEAPPRDQHTVKITGPEVSEKRTSAGEKKKPKVVVPVPKNYGICLDFFGVSFTVINFVKRMLTGDKSHRSYWDSGNSSSWTLQRVKNIRQTHKWCAQIMDELVKQHSGLEYYHVPEGKGPEVRGPEVENVHSPLTPLLMAAKNGAKELVDKILGEIPMAIEDIAQHKNILHVAVENRQPHIFEAIMMNDSEICKRISKSLIQEVDDDGNNVLHLAAKESTYKPWRIPGAAMQLQWEIKWYQFIKESAPPHLIFETNDKNQTPEQIFTENHKELIKDGSEWLKSTSESCSVVAALIAGVSFATSSTMPGGTDSQTGKPTLEGRPAFDLFAITSLVALCFSVTALVMFLAILTSRHQPKDFRRDLPFKLLLGLSSLFVSIAAIFISFCAAHFFEIANQLTKVVFIIYAATCLPVTFYAVAQFPLYLDLLEAILARVPQPSYKGDDL